MMHTDQISAPAEVWAVAACLPSTLSVASWCHFLASLAFCCLSVHLSVGLSVCLTGWLTVFACQSHFCMHICLCVQCTLSYTPNFMCVCRFWFFSLPVFMYLDSYINTIPLSRVSQHGPRIHTTWHLSVAELRSPILPLTSCCLLLRLTSLTPLIGTSHCSLQLLQLSHK